MLASDTLWHKAESSRRSLVRIERALTRWLCVLGLAASIGCCSGSRGEGASGAPLVVAIAGGEGEAVEQFVAIVTKADGKRSTAACPDASAPEVECLTAGLRIPAARGVLGLTIKARGHSFVTTDLDSSTLPIVDGTAHAQVRLRALAPFVVNDAYATGLAVDGGLAAFDALAVSIATELGPAQVVKFYVANLDDQPQAYLLNTRRHPLHYDFARELLDVTQSLADFEAATYQGVARTAFAGSLTYYPEVAADSDALGESLTAPLAMSFFPSDDLTPAQALLCHRLLEERLGVVSLCGGETRLTYLPAGEDAERALAAGSDAFARAGAAWLTQGELYGNLTRQYLNDGVAYGTLRLISPEQLAGAVVSYTDVHVLTRLPNELPVVGGTITAELQTPLAHVNVAARARGTPNLALLGAGTDPRIAPLLGKLVRFEVQAGSSTIEPTTLVEAEAFWAARVLDQVVPRFDVKRDGLPGFAELGFEDRISVGVKPANLAELRHRLPEQAPDGFAVPFRYYDEHFSAARVTAASCAAARLACIAEGRAEATCDNAVTLCAAAADENLWGYAARLIASPEFGTDSELRDAALASLRHHVISTPVAAELAAALDSRVTEVFGGRQIRLRSSTNTEDLPNFSGAGLYESVSASGGGRPVSDRIREVWGSVWGLQAFEERAYWGIDHLAVRMGIAVNPAYDDEETNGVLITQNIANPTVAGMYVNVQLGEVSVTNPTDGSLPEVFAIVPSPTGIQVARQRYSSLSPDAPLLADDEITELFLAADAVQNLFAALYSESPYTLAMDLEFKLVGAQRQLVVKQARPYVR